MRHMVPRATQPPDEKLDMDRKGELYRSWEVEVMKATQGDWDLLFGGMLWNGAVWRR